MNFEQLQDRVQKIEQVMKLLTEAKRRYLEVAPGLNKLVETANDLLNESRIKPLQSRENEKRDLSLLLEELRAILDEVESEAEVLEMKLDAIEVLQHRTR